MTLAEQITQYKKNNPNRLEHVFKDGTQLKAKLHTFLDNCYFDAVNEFKMHGTKNTANWLLNMLK